MTTHPACFYGEGVFVCVSSPALLWNAVVVVVVVIVFFWGVFLLEGGFAVRVRGGLIWDCVGAAPSRRRSGFWAAWGRGPRRPTRPAPFHVHAPDLTPAPCPKRPGHALSRAGRGGGGRGGPDARPCGGLSRDRLCSSPETGERAGPH